MSRRGEQYPRITRASIMGNPGGGLTRPVAAAPFPTSVNTLVVPHSLILDYRLRADFIPLSYVTLSTASLYVESQLKNRIDTNDTWPLDDANFYSENASQADMSEAVSAVTAGEMSGFDAYSLLQYLLHNATGNLTYQAEGVSRPPLRS